MAITLESLDDLTAWDTYRAFMKERLKQLPDGTLPFFLTKKPLAFEVEGKPWRGYGVLVGPKGMLAAKKIRKQGVQFHVGTCTAEGKAFSVQEVPPGLLKFAHLTLKKLRLGYSIAGMDDEGDEAQDGEAPVEAAPAPRTASLERTPELWTATRRTVKASIDKLKAAVREAFASEGADAIADLEASMARLDEVFRALDGELAEVLARAGAAPSDAARQSELGRARALLTEHVRFVRSEPMIAHIDGNPFGIRTDLQATLVKSLKHLAQAIGNA